MAKRQTIWLSTMMVLSLMLIGFYTVNNNVQPANTAATKTTDKTVSKTANQDKAVMEQSDYFVAKHLEENDALSAQVEKLQKTIAEGKLPSDQLEKAKNDLATLNANADKIENVIDRITGEQDFPDALVTIGDDNKVNVTVQAQTLDKKKAVQIMSLVAKEMGISSAKVVVSAHE